MERLPDHLLAVIMARLPARDRLTCLLVSLATNEVVRESLARLDSSAFESDHSTASDWVKCMVLARGACTTLCSSR
jgi:hypothetical protein